MIGSIIGAVGSLAGGLISDRSNKKLTKQAWARDDSSVQRRVADAKKAGIHPLAALGANVQASSPVTTGSSLGDGVASASSSISQGYSRSKDRKIDAQQQKRLDDLATWEGLKANEELNLMATRREWIEEQIKNSKAARLKGLANVMQDGGYLITDDGERWKTGAKQSSKQQEWEDNYGGLIGEIHGIGRYIRDALNQ